MKGGSPQRACLCQYVRPTPLHSAAYSSVPACSGLGQSKTKEQFQQLLPFNMSLLCTETPQMLSLTCYGLEQVCTVFHVVVSIVVVGSLTEHSALLIGSEVLIYSNLKVFSRQPK